MGTRRLDFAEFCQGSGRPRRPGPGRTGVLTVALAAIVLLATACGASSPPSGAGQQTDYQKTLAYAQCVRAHGVPGFPDPNSQGNFILRGKHSFHVGSPQFASASKACQHLLPSTGESGAEQARQAAAQDLKYAACMRAHGVPGFPDPVVQADSIRWGNGHFNAHSPVFQAAQRSCRRFLPGSGAP